MNLLHINASPRRERSLSRRLATAFVTQWLALRPRDVVRERDVGIDHPPLLIEAWIAACFTPEDQRTAAQRDVLAYSVAAIEELAGRDLAPRDAPLRLRHACRTQGWCDQVIRINRTASTAERTWPLSHGLLARSWC